MEVHGHYDIAIATPLQVANALVARATVRRMDEDLMEWRRERLLELAEKHGGNAALGRLLGYKDGAMVGQMLRGERPITEKTIAKAQTLPGSAGWFDRQPSWPPPAPSAVNEAVTQYLPGFEHLAIPLLANSGSMGAGEDQLHDEVVVGRLMVSPQWVQRTIKPLTKPENLRFIHGWGDSMDPTFCDGDILLVDAGVQTIRIDGIYVLEANDRIYIKRVRQRMDGNFEVSSDNSTVKTVDVLDGSRPINVRGRVVWCWNGKKM